MGMMPSVGLGSGMQTSAAPTSSTFEASSGDPAESMAPEAISEVGGVLSETTSGDLFPTDESSASSSASGDVESFECQDDRIFLLLGDECVPCDRAADPDEACAERFPTHPLCADGECRQCRPGLSGACGGDAPACGSDFRCRPCSFHSECPESACHIAEGRCFSPGVVVYVDPEASRCPGFGTGTPEVPSCTFESAVATIPAGEEGVIVIQRPGSARGGPWLLDGNRTVAVIARNSNRVAAGPDFASDDSAAVEVARATLYLDGVVVEAPNGTGVAIGSDSRVVLDNTMISAGEAVGVDNGASAVLRNVFLHTDRRALRVDGEVVLLYSSVFGLPEQSVLCGEAGHLEVRNATFLAEEDYHDDWLDCGSLAVSFSVMELDVDDLGVGNVVIQHEDHWYEASASYAEISPRLTSDGNELVQGVAVWRDGDPPLDIDGDPRPTRPGSSDYAGCDVPP